MSEAGGAPTGGVRGHAQARSWDVVTTVRERPEVLEAFVRHHQAAGCHCVHLYFDDPDDTLLPRWQQHPGVRAQPCVLPRARRDGQLIAHNARQCANATDALAHSQADWVAHIDADEMLYAPGGVGHALAALDDSIVHIRILSHEAVFEDWPAAQRPFNARHFRRGAQGEAGRRQVRAVYPADVIPLLNRGMSGHAVGKSMIRRGRAPALGGVHFWRDPASKEPLPVSPIEDGSLVLLHFDAISFPIWKEKLAKRVARQVRMSGRAAHRRAQVERFAQLQGDETALQALFCKLYVLDEAARQLLLSESGMVQIDLGAGPTGA